MYPDLEVPFTPHLPPAPARLEPPVVAVAPRWIYRDVVRDPRDVLTEAELDALGEEHWELVGVVSDGARIHFYLKRERPA